ELANNDLSGLGDSLKAYYSFDYDVIVDESFNGNDGILTNGAAYAPAGAPANQGWRIDADALYVEPLDEDDNVYHVTYEFEDMHGSGNYDIGLEVKTTSGAVIPMHEFEGCKFMVTVDAVDMGIFTIDPSRTEFAAGSINTMLGDGVHTVKFTWLNPEKDLNIEIGKAFISDTAYVDKADIDGDGEVTQEDKRRFSLHMIKGAMSQEMQLEGKTYYAIVNSVSNKVVLTDAEGNRYTNVAERDPKTALRIYEPEAYIVAPYEALDGLRDFTITQRVKFDETMNDESCLISAAAGSQYDAFTLWYSKERNEWYIHINGEEFHFAPNDAVEDLDWHTVALRRLGKTITLYIDGYATDTMLMPTASIISVSENGFIIGQDQDSLGGGFDPMEMFKGELDDMSIWEKALTSEEIRQLYAGVPASSISSYGTDCRAWFNLDEGVGEVLVNKAVTGMNGTLAVIEWIKADYEYETPETSKATTFIDVPKENEPATMVRYIIGINPETWEITLVEEDIYDLNKDANFDKLDEKIIKDAMSAVLIEKDANDMKTFSEASYTWLFNDDNSMTNAGVKDAMRAAPYLEYVVEADQAGVYYAGLSFRNDSPYSKPNNWTLPWGSNSQKWDIFPDNFRRDLTAGVYTTAEDAITGTMKMDITGTDPCLYYTRYYATENDPELRQGWPDGTNGAVDMDTANLVEISYRYTGSYTPTTAAISWSRRDRGYDLTDIDSLSYTHSFDVTGVKNAGGDYTTIVVDMSSVEGWIGDMEAFRFDPIEGTTIDSGTIEIKYIAFKEAPDTVPTNYWGDYPGIEGQDELQVRVYLDDAYIDTITAPWVSTEEALDYYVDALRLELSEGEHFIKYEWGNDQGEETSIRIEKMFLSGISDTTADFDGDYIVSLDDYNELVNNVGISPVPTTMELGGRIYEIAEVETYPGSGEYVYEFRGFEDGAELTTSNPREHSVEVGGANYNIYINELEGGMTLSSKGLLSIPVVDGEIRFNGTDYAYQMIDDELYQFIETVTVASATAVQHPNWNAEVDINGKTYGVLEASSGKVTLIPAERVRLVLSAMSDLTTGTEFRLNNIPLSPAAEDTCFANGVAVDPPTD
ncbi:MAG: LamG-like jellyroll fold domain-containing protein, partial [Candidatus Omnitrophota bacterium]